MAKELQLYTSMQQPASDTKLMCMFGECLYNAQREGGGGGGDIIC